MKQKTIYGLIGYPLSHSFSKKYFTEKFKKENIKNCEYHNFEIPNINLLHNLIRQHQNIKGLSVTKPYKESIIPLLDNLDETAKIIGAVNTVCINKEQNGTKLTGYNTDFYGFHKSLTELLQGNESNALIFGSGGASKAVQYALQKIGINYKIVSGKKAKNNTINYNDVTPTVIFNTDILINTTPLGMYPKINEAINIPYEYIKQGSIAYDLIYNPATTLFLKKTRKYGALICNGLKMLELQAEKAWSIFTNKI